MLLLIIIGSIFLLIAGVGYVLTNPQVIEDMRATLQQMLRSANDAQQLAKDVQGLGQRVSPDASIDQQFADLRLGEMVEIHPDRDNVLERKERSVTCLGVLQAQERNGRNFRDRKEPWRFFVLDDSIMLFERPDGWCWFDMSDSSVLGGESAREFDNAGEMFSSKGQSPRSHTITWKRKKLAILDVGYLKFERMQGTCHLDHGEMVKYMLAEAENGTLIYVENLKVGTDRVWSDGKALGMSMKPYVGNILRAA
jgi:hypothetical protein